MWIEMHGFVFDDSFLRDRYFLSGGGWGKRHLIYRRNCAILIEYSFTIGMAEKRAGIGDGIR